MIHNHEGKPLLQEKSSGETWSLPAGGNEIGESPQEATIRQVTFRNAPNQMPEPAPPYPKDELFRTF
ncbi:NUDIX domain-containing protein [Paraburkholderia madseniana]|uniref:NUDIX domain-containing protein n=1 Tax=Paraburkholderia madseniana TaxID=2599607 RepID=UPI001412A165|nr:NUDIX domain-containing protein [Paraburkholderia madseniana]